MRLATSCIEIFTHSLCADPLFLHFLKQNMKLTHNLPLQSFWLCKQCYKKDGHQHNMDEKTLDSSQGSTGGSSTDAGSSQQSAAALQGALLNSNFDMLQHVCRCNNAECTVNDCKKMKRLAMSMPRRETAEDAELYERTLKHCFTHAGGCTQTHCSLPLCLALRRILKQARQEQV